MCTTILDRATGVMTELVENGRPLRPEELDAFRRAYAEEAAKADVAVIAGSLPAGTPNSFYRELVERTPCPAVLDFRGEGLLACLDLKPLVVKPNREELAQTVGQPYRRRPATARRHAIAQPSRGPMGGDHARRRAGLAHLGVEDLPAAIRCRSRRWSTRWAAATPWPPAIAWAIRRAATWSMPSSSASPPPPRTFARLDTGRLDPARAQQQAAEVRVEEMS